MSFRLSWQRGRPADEDVVMEDVESWNPSNMVWKAGRQLSAWLKPSFLQTISGQAWPSQYSTSYPGSVQSGQSTAPQIIRRTPLIGILPPEILGEIFFHYVHDRGSNPLTSPPPTWKFGRILAYKGSRTNPIVLGHICSYWRTLSLSIPTLWSTIYVYRPQFQEIPLLAFWLERSGNAPLNLTLIQAGREGGVDLVIREIIADVLSQSHRWRRVTLHLDADSQELFGMLGQKTLPLLEGFDINLFHWPLRETQELCHVLYSAPALRQVRFGRAFTNSAVLAGAVWDQLTEIDINYLEVSNLFLVLSSCKSLLRCSVTIIDDSSKEEFGSMIRLPQLRSLTFDLIDDVSHVFDQLILPSLTALTLVQGFGFTCPLENGWSSLSGLLRRSNCRLQKFECSRMSLGEDLLISHLTSPLMASLVHLTIQSMVTDKFLLALAYQSEPFSLPLPLLKTLHLEDCRSTDGTLTAMLRSRASTSACLDSVFAILKGSIFSNDLAAQIPNVKLVLLQN